ncbi:MAG: ABC transporter permease [Alphaproteobacteria bacterium]
MRLEPRTSVPALYTILAPVAAVLASLVISAGLLLWSGAPVLGAYALLFDGALGSVFAITETLTRATPLMLTGLAAAVAFRAKLWNIGAEGQLYAGAIAVTAAGTGLVTLPQPVMVPLLMLVGAAAGALLLLGPALLKIRLGVDEVVTTLLLNFIVLLVVGLLVEGPMKDPLAFGWPQAMPVVPEGEYPKLVPRTRLHLGLAISLGAAALVWFMNRETVWGYEMRAVGANLPAARFAGMPTDRVMVRVALVSGGLAGLAGVGEVCGLKGYLTLDLSPSFGYGGIVVAMLAQLHPAGVVLAALFVAVMFVGADAMSRAVAVSSYLADVIVASSLLSMLVAALLARYRLRRG